MTQWDILSHDEADKHHQPWWRHCLVTDCIVSWLHCTCRSSINASTILHEHIWQIGFIPQSDSFQSKIQNEGLLVRFSLCLLFLLAGGTWWSTTFAGEMIFGVGWGTGAPACLACSEAASLWCYTFKQSYKRKFAALRLPHTDLYPLMCIFVYAKVGINKCVYKHIHQAHRDCTFLFKKQPQ